jgi:hypothetical protein
LKEKEGEKILEKVVQTKTPLTFFKRWIVLLLVLLLIPAGGIFLGTVRPWKFLSSHTNPSPQGKETPPFTLVSPPQTSKVTNRLGQEILVVRGELQNNDTQPHSFLKVKVVLKREDQTVIGEKEVYAGNTLTEGELETLPLSRLEEMLKVEMGSALRNFNLPPQGIIPFYAIFFPPPSPPFSIEVIPLESQRGTQTR